jgi:hypothetical protein
MALKPCLLATACQLSAGHFLCLLLLRALLLFFLILNLCFLSSFGLLRPLGCSDLDGQVSESAQNRFVYFWPLGPFHLAGFLLFPFSQPGISLAFLSHFSESEGPKLACRTNLCPSFQLPGRPAMHNACPADSISSPLSPHVKQAVMSHKARHPHLVLAKLSSSASRPRGLVRSSSFCCSLVLSAMPHPARPNPHSLCMF